MLTFIGLAKGKNDNEELLAGADIRVPHMGDMEITFHEFMRLTGLADPDVLAMGSPEVLEYAMAGNHVSVVPETGQVRVSRVEGLELLPFSGNWESLREPSDLYLFWVPEDTSRGRLRIGKDVMVIYFHMFPSERPEFGDNDYWAARMDLLPGIEDMRERAAARDPEKVMMDRIDDMFLGRQPLLQQIRRMVVGAVMTPATYLTGALYAVAMAISNARGIWFEWRLRRHAKRRMDGEE